MKTQKKLSFEYGGGEVNFTGLTHESTEQLKRAVVLGNQLIEARIKYWKLATDVARQYGAQVEELGGSIIKWHEVMSRAEEFDPRAEISKCHEEIGKRLTAITDLISLWFNEIMNPDTYEALEPFALHPKPAPGQSSCAVESVEVDRNCGPQEKEDNA